jgi:cell division transport system permease protein
VTVLRYSLEEARASLVRGGRGALMSMGTIAIAFLALGGFLLVTTNLQRLADRWMEAAEVSVYLRDDLDEATRDGIESRLRGQPDVSRVDFISRDEALARFRAGFPELADVADGLGGNPFPASFEVRLRPGGQVADRAAALAAAIDDTEGVADVQFDRRWLERVLSLIAGVRAAGLTVAVVLLLGAAFTVSAVVRLSLHARRDEVDIMMLVGAPAGYVRGPFVMEGLLLGGLGAVAALVVLAAGFVMLRGWGGTDLSGVLGAEDLRFLRPADAVLLVVAGLGVGALAGGVAARAAR